MALVEPLARARAVARFGGKAAQLAALTGVPGVHVPPGFAIAAEVFWQLLEDSLPAGQWPERLLAGPEAERRGDRLAAIRERILAAPIPPRAWSEIVAAWRALGGSTVAVRSSALHEDSEEASAAGLQETILGVTGEEALARAVKTCFGSLYRERTLAYLARRGAKGRIGLAVVVQRLVEADKAGVLFTIDPLGRDGSVMVVEAAHGLGCSVVDGSIAPDVYRLDRTTGMVRERHVGDKRFAMRAREGGLERISLTPEEATRPAVEPEELAQLAQTGRAIEHAVGSARDIEWAFERGTLWILQARPIVGAQGARDDRLTWVWSNVNVGEALPGVATPLTWTVAVAFSELGFRRAFGSLGLTVPADAELVGQFHGRIYLNLTQFMRIASQVPMLDPRLLLEFGGGGGLEMLERQVQRGSWGRFLLRAPVTGARFVAENAALTRRLERFEHDFAEYRRAFEARDLGALSLPALGDVLDELGELLDRTGGLMLTCASGSLSSIVALRGLLHLRAPRQAMRLERELLTGNADLESAAPGIALVYLGELARREPAAREVILRTEPAAMRLEMLPEGGPTRRAFEAFLRAYGYRAAREAELTTPRWREEPQVLFATIRAQLERGDTQALARVEKQFETRAWAERELEAMLPPPARAVARHLLARTRRFVRLRERMRARVTEVLGFYRTLALEISRRIEAREPGAGPDAAFFLRLDEVRAFLRGELTDVGPLVAARRADVARDRARPDPPPVFVGAPPPVAPPVVQSGDSLRGVAASPGSLEGTVRVLRDPAEGASLKPGEVLVVPVADVGWTPLFLMAAAVVTELGGALSHAALVAREYGVPAVVNVAGATRALATGDRVRVDGDRGVVQVLQRVAHAEGGPDATARVQAGGR
jgi:pyruvate,water dikinase